MNNFRQNNHIYIIDNDNIQKKYINNNHTCQYCNKSFTTKSILETHIKKQQSFA